ncbi:MAG: glutamate formimidoyltransferase [Elusimicrobia bacterium]|nr:glutamate formimidoyltransferase [Elusimicrobiota bacterium]MDY6039307.1 glutamate formimidoyltransferase [Elusimicrobiaceae bacterium]
MKIMEAVPNISEGRRTDVIENIAERVKNASPARILHVDSNADANRTVFTLAGEPDDVRKSAFVLIQSAAELIDMRFHSGAHPRIGAVDVCPFVPVKNMTLDEAAQQAKKLAKDTAEKLNIPVYLYEANAQTMERKNLAFIRQGEYESLPQKLKELPPDFGPHEFSENVQKTGATVIGARNFLIAFNISLNTRDVTAVKQIASVLREKNGGLPTIKAIGWYMADYQCAQVSFNLTDYKTTGLAQVFEACKQEAARRGLAVTGSELIGLAPEDALLNAGRFYAPGLEEKTALLETAVRKLGLNKIRSFNIQERILEYRL